MYKDNESLPSSVSSRLSNVGQTCWRNEYNHNEQSGEVFAMSKAWEKVNSLGMIKAESYNGQPRGEDGRFKAGKQTSNRKKEDKKQEVAGAYYPGWSHETPKGRPPYA